jgi:predicted transcriptional regulator
VGNKPPGRVALMSIRPEFATAILSGDKAVEFRKRPVADDVSHVLIYATLPVGSLLGWFLVEGQSTTSPQELWDQFKGIGGITEDRFFEYYAQRESGTGILVGSAEKFSPPLPLAELGDVSRPPQSFQYLTDDQAATFFRMVTEPSKATSN